jgi:parallel beta-helix repeat protein
MLIGIFISFSVILFLNFETFPNNTDNLRDSQVSGDTILIQNELDWFDAIVAGRVSGGGSYENPFIIQNLIIDAKEMSSGIRIENNVRYVNIQNCTIRNSDAGVSLFNSININISENNFIENLHGIRLEYCDYISILNNTAYDNRYGIRMAYTNNITVVRNTINYTYVSGINIVGSHNISITDNLVDGTMLSSRGISLASCNNSIISRNIVRSNLEIGISLSKCYHNIVRLNEIQRNDIGIFLTSSNHNEIKDNIFSMNNVDIEGFIEPGPEFDSLILIVDFITIIIFPGMLVFTREKTLKKGILSPRKLKLLSFSLTICIVGGLLLTWTSLDLLDNQLVLASLLSLGFGILIIIGAISGAKYHNSGNLLCLILGGVSLPIVALWIDVTIISLIGIILVLIGSVFNLTRVLRSKTIR